MTTRIVPEFAGGSPVSAIANLFRATQIAGIVVALTLTGCAGVKGQTVTMESLDQTAVQVHQSNLSEDEKRAFDEVKARADTGDYDITDKTVGQLITDQLAYDADQVAQAKKAQQLADQVRAKHNADVQALKNAVTVALVGKDFQPSDWENGQYQSYVVVKFAFHNNSGKTVRAIKGEANFRTTLGDLIYGSKLEYEEPIHRGATAVYSGTVEYNEYNDALTRLKNADLSNLRLDWEPDVILFADGSKLEVTQ